MRIEETDERVNTGDNGVLRSFRWWFPLLRAEQFVTKHRPLIPSYRLVVERVGFFHYEAVAYQNKAVPLED